MGVGDELKVLPEEIATRTLGYCESVVLLCNNVIGPGLIALPAVFQVAHRSVTPLATRRRAELSTSLMRLCPQDAGWAVSSSLMVLVMLLSAVAGAALLEVHDTTVLPRPVGLWLT